MARDPYSVLGVGRTASDEEIRSSFRRLAKEYHPDRNRGDAKAEERFKALNQAYDIIGDPKKRRKFDAGLIDADGTERAESPFHHEGAGGFGYQGGFGQGGGFKGGFGGSASGDDIGDIFSNIFGQRTRPGASNAPIAGEDVSYKLSVDFLEAVNGSKKRIILPSGDALDVRIPKGFRDGQSLRLKGKGRPGANGGRPGDALVTVSVKAHPLFERDGDNILVELPISVDEAVLGAKIAVPTIDGSVTLKIPQNSSGGTVLRLKGKGIAGRGDQHVRLKIVLPSETDEQLRAFLERRRGGPSFDPRKDWGKD